MFKLKSASDLEANSIPAEFLCPITGKLMEDPVAVVANGHSYERAAITDLLRHQGQRVAEHTLIPNYALKACIESDTSSQTSVAQSDVSDHFKCPILLEIMQNPVMTIDGHSYEKEGIRTWFMKGANTSPITNQRLQNTTLIPNRALKHLIESFSKKASKLDAPIVNPLAQPEQLILTVKPINLLEKQFWWAPLLPIPQSSPPPLLPIPQWFNNNLSLGDAIKNRDLALIKSLILQGHTSFSLSDYNDGYYNEQSTDFYDLLVRLIETSAETRERLLNNTVRYNQSWHLFNAILAEKPDDEICQLSSEALSASLVMIHRNISYRISALKNLAQLDRQFKMPEDIYSQLLRQAISVFNPQQVNSSPTLAQSCALVFFLTGCVLLPLGLARGGSFNSPSHHSNNEELNYILVIIGTLCLSLSVCCLCKPRHLTEDDMGFEEHANEVVEIISLLSNENQRPRPEDLALADAHPQLHASIVTALRNAAHVAPEENRQNFWCCCNRVSDIEAGLRHPHPLITNG